MKRLTIQTLLLLFAVAWCLPQQATAQKRGKDNGPMPTKIIRGCEYQVLPGLAEVTKVEKVVSEDESALQYDEYQILFKFTPMEGGTLLTKLQDTEIEFYLKSGMEKVRVGPEYLDHYHIREGTKYAMTLLQNKMGACLEDYTYESRGLPNDLFEARPNLLEYKKKETQKKLYSKESEYEERKEEEAMTPSENPTMPDIDTTAKEEPEPIEAEVKEAEPVEPVEIDPDAEPIDPNITEAELRKQIEAELREKGDIEEVVEEEIGVDVDVDEEKIRKEVEAELRKKYEAKMKAELEAKKEAEKEKEEARKREEKRRKREEKRRKKQLEKERERKLAELEEQREAEEERIKAELEAKIKAELEAELAAEKAKIEAEKAAEEDDKRRQAELLKKKEELKKEVALRLANEAKRKNCTFEERQAGTIEVLEVNKVADEKDSYFGYTEYEVKVRFRPNNFADLSKRDKKEWEQEFVFTLDPKGQNANPSAGYIRKHKVFKGAKYEGFAQKLESGICNELMLYSPDLPIDKTQIKK